MTIKKPKPIRKGRNRAEVISLTKGSGIYEIRAPSFSDKPFKVACDAETRGGNWMIILRWKDVSVYLHLEGLRQVQSGIF